MDVSVLIVNYNTRELLKSCLDSVFQKVKGVSFEIIVIDNASADGSPDMVRSFFPKVKLIENTVNVGFGPANNIGAAAAAGRYLFLLNSDARLISDTIAGLYHFLEENPDYALAGPRVLLPDMTRQPKIYGQLPTLRRIFNDALLLSALFPKSAVCQGMNMDGPRERISSAGWISGVCLLIRKAVFADTGGFDERIFLYAEDMDLCRRIGSRGWRLAHIDDFSIVHACGASSPTEADRIRNSVLQQRYFLTMLAGTFGKGQMTVVRLFLFSGLILRTFAGLVMKYDKPAGNGLLLKTSLARLKTLFARR